MPPPSLRTSPASKEGGDATSVSVAAGEGGGGGRRSQGRRSLLRLDAFQSQKAMNSRPPFHLALLGGAVVGSVIMAAAEAARAGGGEGGPRFCDWTPSNRRRR